MPKVSPIQGNFGTGEISPLAQGRVDLDRYKTALAVCQNYIPTIQGGLTRRPGTEYIVEVKDSTKKTRLVPFRFSQTDAYILEFGHEYVRFHRDYGPVLDENGAVVEYAMPFTEDEIFELSFAQSADYLYICHKNHLPQKLIRYSDTFWSSTQMTGSLGPWDYSALEAKVTVGSASFSTTLTTTPTGLPITAIANNGGKFEITVAFVNQTWIQDGKLRVHYDSGTPSAEGDWDVEYLGNNKFLLLGSTYSGTYSAGQAKAYTQIFKSTDVGRYYLVKQSASGGAVEYWRRFQITSLVNSTTANVSNINSMTPDVGVTYDAYPSLFWTGNGPTAACFFEDRLFFTGSPNAGQRVDGSKIGDYENFQTISENLQVYAEYSISFVLNSDDVNIGKWMFADEKGLIIGTLANEWTIKSASSSEAFSALSVSAKLTSSFGSSDCYPVRAGKAILFVQKSGRKIREYHYFQDVESFRATDLSVLSEHMTLGGLKQLAYQKDPQQIVWAVTNNGKLVAMTYERDIDNLRAGWHKHELGGSNLVESVAVIPSPDGIRDDVWLVVKRFVDGAWVRYIEVITKFFDDEDEQEDAFFVDSGLTYDLPIAISGITNANPCVLTATAHGLSNGDSVYLRGIIGTTELNQKIFTVANKTTNTFELSGIDSTDYGTYLSGGYVRKRVQTITGLDHLEGETVQVLADGAVQNSKVVTGGSITLDAKAATVTVGLGYNSDAQLPIIDAGAADGTSIGKTRRTNRLGLFLNRSLNLLVGTDFENMTRLFFRNANEAMGKAPSLFSGIIVETLDADYDFENKIAWRQDQPLPSTILAVMPSMTTQDR